MRVIGWFFVIFSLFAGLIGVMGYFFISNDVGMTETNAIINNIELVYEIDEYAEKENKNRVASISYVFNGQNYDDIKVENLPVQFNNGDEIVVLVSENNPNEAMIKSKIYILTMIIPLLFALPFFIIGIILIRIGKKIKKALK